jgi:hypothetical protein
VDINPPLAAASRSFSTAAIMALDSSAMVFATESSSSIPIAAALALVPASSAKYAAQFFPDLPEDRLLQILWDEHDVILTLPSRVT